MGRCKALRVRVSRPTTSPTGHGTSSLAVIANITGTVARLSATYSTTARVSGSDQCRSSITSTRPPAVPSRPRSWMIASARTGDGASPALSPASVGTIAPRAGRHGTSSGSEGSPRPLMHCNNASVSGRYGVVVPFGTPRPTATTAPRERAAAASSRTSAENRGVAMSITTQPGASTRAPRTWWVLGVVGHRALLWRRRWRTRGRRHASGRGFTTPARAP
jgi:hypothetical protein